MGDKELLILDEPTNGLDPAGVREIRSLIKGLPEALGVTMLISIHILTEILLIADYVGILRKGRLLFQGTLEELKAKGNREIAIKAEPMKNKRRTTSKEKVLEWKIGTRTSISQGAILISSG